MSETKLLFPYLQPGQSEEGGRFLQLLDLSDAMGREKNTGRGEIGGGCPWMGSESRQKSWI